ncbi:MAG: hypothetical protein J3Q66DRAFT_400017 [Benniella sp.]|nr:MAG: hypothetical protein J3Q66DRAFT_400017 [Benniella sp.]
MNGSRTTTSPAISTPAPVATVAAGAATTSETPQHRKLRMARVDHGFKECSSTVNLNQTPQHRKLMMASMDHGIEDAALLISVKWIKLDRMDAYKTTRKLINGAAFAYLFSSSLETTASETKDDQDGSWVWGLQQHRQFQSNGHIEQDACKAFKKHIDSAAFACIFSFSLDTQRQKLGMTRTDHGIEECNSTVNLSQMGQIGQDGYMQDH